MVLPAKSYRFEKILSCPDKILQINRQNHTVDSLTPRSLNSCRNIQRIKELEKNNYSFSACSFREQLRYILRKMIGTKKLLVQMSKIE